MVARLIDYAYENGMELTFGHAWRCQDCPTGSEVSLHKVRLAVDFNLFKDGVYMTKTADYFKLGKFWEELGGTWGGRFSDGNHFSLEHEGRK